VEVQEKPPSKNKAMMLLNAFRPRPNSLLLGELIGESPFEFLKRHHAKVFESVGELDRYLARIPSAGYEETAELTSRITKLGVEGDEICRSLKSRMSRDVYLPVGKMELFSFVESQDSIGDKVEDIAALLSFRELKTPPGVLEIVSDFWGNTFQLCRSFRHSFASIDLLIESSFEGRDALEASNRIDQVRSRFDALQERKTESIRGIYQFERSTDSLNLMMSVQCIKGITKLASRVKNAGDSFGNLLRG